MTSNVVRWHHYMLQLAVKKTQTFPFLVHVSITKLHSYKKKIQCQPSIELEVT